MPCTKTCTQMHRCHVDTCTCAEMHTHVQPRANTHMLQAYAQTHVQGMCRHTCTGTCRHTNICTDTLQTCARTHVQIPVLCTDVQTRALHRRADIHICTDTCTYAQKHMQAHVHVHRHMQADAHKQFKIMLGVVVAHTFNACIPEAGQSL